MDLAHIAELLRSYTPEADLPPALLEQLNCYLDLLLRWNARMNLTSVRDPEQVVSRHFGESLFAARVLLGTVDALPQGLKPASHSDPHGAAEAAPIQNHLKHQTLADVGSGAGFPGIPIKLSAPELALTLIESQNKKATFLREAIRTLGLEGANVFSGRAEQWGKTSDLVTLRAVEQFERALPAVAKLVAVGGKLCLLISTGQVPTAQEILGPDWTWQEPNVVPQSEGRVVLVGSHP
jgi:16S rRNA (guanine527-N7)-methyltransferase